MNKEIAEYIETIPDIEQFGAVVKEVKEDRLGYPFFLIEGLKKDKYLEYLDTLKEYGFQVCQEIGRPGGSYLQNATYRKGKFFVSIKRGSGVSRISYHFHPEYVEQQPNELFDNIPIMEENGILIGEAQPVGGGGWQLVIERTLYEHYQRYLKRLEREGFTKYVDNGNGLNGKVFNSIYTKNHIVLNVTYLKRTNKTYLSACQNLPLSKHLNYQDKYVEDNQVGLVTKLHMLEMWKFGNSFIFQLKNGHFIVSDGGYPDETEYFLEYLENLVPKGEKPVVEGWFISHAHPDHTGVLRSIGRKSELNMRVYVEGVYYTEPSEVVFNMQIGCPRAENELLKECIRNLHTTTGKSPEIYRMYTGQRYYFSDIIVEVALSLEQLEPEEYYKHDFNDSSTWLMFYIEGQKCLFGGDGHTGGMHFIMKHYDKQYMELDIATSLHHSASSKNYFTDFCKIKTLLITRGTEPTRRLEENRYLRTKVSEWFSRAEGTRVLTFPYKVGSSEILPHFDWKYHQGLEKPNH